jgi:hypothetical protein
MTILSSGNVGIGTTNPGATLHLGSQNEEIRFGDGATSRSSLIFKGHNTGTTFVDRYAIKNISGSDSAAHVWYDDNGAGEMTLTNRGSLGLGGEFIPSNGLLEINGTHGSVSLSNWSYAELTTGGANLGAAVTQAYSLYASGAIAASEFNAISDARVKNIKEVRDNKKDMLTLEKMNVYEFDYIDKLNYGIKDKIGFIAQDLEKLNENLVNYSKNFIPNIFKTFKLINKNKIILDKEYDLEVNDILKIEITVYSQKIMIEKKVLAILNEVIIIETIELIESEDIFIYGKKVEDFRTVNFEQIIGMNVSSIKYLYNEIKEIKENQEKLYNLIKNKLNI